MTAISTSKLEWRLWFQVMLNCRVVREFIKTLIKLNLETYVNFRGKIYLDIKFPHKSLMILLWLLWTILQVGVSDIFQTWDLWSIPLIPLSWSRVRCFETFKTLSKKSQTTSEFWKRTCIIIVKGVLKTTNSFQLIIDFRYPVSIGPESKLSSPENFKT